jgi:hypothetical protein
MGIDCDRKRNLLFPAFNLWRFFCKKIRRRIGKITIPTIRVNERRKAKKAAL